MGNINVICQNCGVGLEIEDDVTSFDCPNCGARLHTNFQKIEDTETDYQDYVVRNHTVQSRRKGHGSFAAIILTIILFAGVGFYIGSVKPGNVQEVLSDVVGTPKPAVPITWPWSFDEAKTLSYSELSSQLKDRKFTNVKGTPVETKWGNKAGKIKEIQIIAAGKIYSNRKIKKNQEFMSDVEINITYYK